MNTRSAVLAVFASFALIANVVQSTPTIQFDYEHHSLDKREAAAEPAATSAASAEPEPESSSAVPESEPANTTGGEPKKGFFENIKKGASAAMDKVKATAGTIKDSVKNAVNKAAGKIKDATEAKKDCAAGDANCTTDNSMMSSTMAPEASSVASKRKRSSGDNPAAEGQGSGTSTAMPDSTDEHNGETDRDSNMENNSRSSSRVHKKSLDMSSSSTDHHKGPILVHGPEDTVHLNPSVFIKEKNTTVKDHLIPTLPPLGAYPNLKKPGKCPALAPGLNCVALGNDAAQCRADSGCPGNKKCCFFACQPYSNVGVCETPVFYTPPPMSQKSQQTTKS